MMNIKTNKSTRLFWIDIDFQLIPTGMAGLRALNKKKIDRK